MSTGIQRVMSESTAAARLSGLAARLGRPPRNGRTPRSWLALGAGRLFDSLEAQLFSSSIGPLGGHFGASVSEQDAILTARPGGTLPGAPAGCLCRRCGGTDAATRPPEYASRSVTATVRP